MSAPKGHHAVIGADAVVRAAFRHVTSGPDLALVVGYAGTGKSAMFAVARAAWEAEGLIGMGSHADTHSDPETQLSES